MRNDPFDLVAGDIVRLKPGLAWRYVLGRAANDDGVVGTTFAVNGKPFVSVRFPQREMVVSMMPADIWIKCQSPYAEPAAD